MRTIFAASVKRQYVLFLFAIFSLLFFACTPRAKTEVPSDVLPSEQPEAPTEAILITYVQGEAWVIRGNARIPAEEGMQLLREDSIETDAYSSLEMDIGSVSVVRLMPATRLELRSLPLSAQDSVDINLFFGGIWAKVTKLIGRQEFIVRTSNSAAGVRGTSFMVRYDESSRKTPFTTIAVQDGAVAVLPSSPLVDSLIEGHRDSPVAGAVLRSALELAPAAMPGQEIRVGGEAVAQEAADAAASREALDKALSALIVAAEGLRSGGLRLEDEDDVRALLAPDGSSEAQALARPLGYLVPEAASSDVSGYLDLLRYLREPGNTESKLPAAMFMPLDRFTTTSPQPQSQATANPWPELQWARQLSDTAISGILTRSGQVLLAQDAAGRVYALDVEGNLLWKNMEISLGVTALEDTVYLVQEERMLLVDSQDGSIRGEYRFDGYAINPNSRAVAVPEGVALCTPRGLALVRAENATLLREILVDGGLLASPVLADRVLAAISGSGTIVIMDVAAGTILREIDAGLSRDVFAPRYRSGRIVSVDRGGRIAVVNVADKSLLWAASLGLPIGAEPELAADRVYLWSNSNAILTLSAIDGSELEPAIKGVESPPLLSDNILYYGTVGGVLVLANAEDGKILKRIQLPVQQSVRPIMIGGALFVGTKDGRVLKVDVRR